MKYNYLSIQQKIISKNINKSINRILKKNNYILGAEVNILEEKLAKFVNSNYCIATSSGTDSLLVALMALGIKSGDEVITTPFSWISAVEVILLIGATPVFCDIDEKTFNLNSELIEKKISKKTKAIIATSLFGQTCSLKKINHICKKNNIYFIEDAAQSYGAKEDKINSCSHADISCTSFFPVKPLGCYGDGGACFTNSKSLYLKIKKIINHGQIKKNEHLILGSNFRMDTLQAAILIEKLKIFKNEISLRNSIAKNYKNLITKYCPNIITPFIEKNNYSTYSSYTIILNKRDLIFKKLKDKNFPVFIFYKKPIYNQPIIKNRNTKLVITEKLCKKVLSLPIHPYMNYSDQKKIIIEISKFI